MSGLCIGLRKHPFGAKRAMILIRKNELGRYQIDPQLQYIWPNQNISPISPNWVSLKCDHYELPLKKQYIYIYLLVGGFNPFEKYDRQIGSFPQGSGWNKKYLSCHQPVYIFIYIYVLSHFLSGRKKFRKSHYWSRLRRGVKWIICGMLDSLWGCFSKK